MKNKITVRYVVVFVVGFALTLLTRAARLFPGNDPIFAGVAVMARRKAVISSVLFSVLAFLAFDYMFGTVGSWTFITAGVYGALAFALSTAYRKISEIQMYHHILFGAGFVLLFDFITGPVVSSIMWDVPFAVSVAGQVPFTLWHLGSVLAYTVIVIPVVEFALDKVVLYNKEVASLDSSE